MSWEPTIDTHCSPYSTSKPPITNMNTNHIREGCENKFLQYFDLFPTNICFLGNRTDNGQKECNMRITFVFHLRRPTLARPVMRRQARAAYATKLLMPNIGIKLKVELSLLKKENFWKDNCLLWHMPRSLCISTATPCFIITYQQQHHHSLSLIISISIITQHQPQHQHQHL